MRRCAVAIVVSSFLVGCGGQTIVTGATPDAAASTPDAAASTPDAAASTPDAATAMPDAAADAGTTSFPTGTYTTCAQGLRDNMLDLAGFEEGATLAVAQNGGTLTATYVDQNGLTSTLSFVAKTSTSATLVGSAQVSAGFSVDCVQGVGAMGTYPAVMNATAGALSYTAGTVFLTLTGTVHGDAGPCGPTTLPATFWVVGADGPAAEPAATAAPPSTVLSGAYTCTSQVETAYRSGGKKEFVTGGSDGGTLTLTRDGATLEAHYSGDTALAGTLHLDLATATTATAAAGQDATTPCEVPFSTASPPPQTSGTLSVAAASLTAVGPTLFLSFSGAMDASSACAGARKAGSLICKKQ